MHAPSSAAGLWPPGRGLGSDEGRHQTSLFEWILGWIRQLCHKYLVQNNKTWNQISSWLRTINTPRAEDGRLSMISAVEKKHVLHSRATCVISDIQQGQGIKRPCCLAQHPMVLADVWGAQWSARLQWMLWHHWTSAYEKTWSAGFLMLRLWISWILRTRQMVF